MKRFYFSKLVTLIAILSGCNLSAIAQTSTYSYVTTSVQTYSVPAGVTSISIQAKGAQGGSQTYSGYAGGQGAIMQGNFTVVPGHVLDILIGQQPVAGTYLGGGGGGTFVWDVTASNTLLIAAGGGGGAGMYTGAGINAVTTTNGTNGGGGTTYGGAGTSGNGGTTVGSCCGGGGAGGCGWLSNGAVGFGCGNAGGGVTPLGGGTGGTFAGTAGYDGNGGYGGGGGSQGICSYAGAGGGGGYSGGGGGDYTGNADPGGGGGSYNIGTSQTNSVSNTGNGQVVIVVLCNAPGVIAGSTSVCMGASITLADPTGFAGGTWSSSNTLVANIGSTGVVTTVGTGTTTITYNVNNPCGALATAVVTVNPSPTAISGTASVCSFNTTTLSSSPGGGTWSSSNTLQANVSGAVSSSTVVTGGAAGVPVVTYTIPGGCFVTIPVTVNAGPAAITGTTLICNSGGTTTLNDPTPGGSWTSSFIPVASISGSLGGTASITGGSPGNATIAYSLSTGCLATTTVTVNNLPAFIVSGSGSYCSNTTSTYHVLLSGSTAGAANQYQLFNGSALVNTLTGTGSGLDFGLQPAGIYTVTATNTSTGCSAPMSGNATITINQAPGIYPLSTPSGVTSYCIGSPGIHILTGNSDLNVNYQLFNGAAPVGGPVGGTGTGGLNFGPDTAGTYTIVGTNVFNSCTNPMSGTITLVSNPLPVPELVNGGGPVCAGDITGRHIGLSFSSLGINYTLLRAGVSTGIVVGGANSELDFGTFTTPGVYTATASNATSGCSSAMTGSVSITAAALPTAHNVMGTGSYCVGGTGLHVGLDLSDAGIKYQLFNGLVPVGGVITGPAGGGALDFGLQLAGTYTVMATNPVTGCSNTMEGSAIITAEPLPVSGYIVSGDGTNYCAGSGGIDITLSQSDFGVNYQLYNGTTPVPGGLSLQSGDGGALDFGPNAAGGIYTVVGTTDDAAACSSTMTGSASVTMDPLPAPFSVTGGGGYCQGTGGAHVGLSFSGAGISYQLWYNSTVIVNTVSGSGSSLDFGIEPAGFYTVIASNLATGCSSNMPGTAVVTLNSLPTNTYSISPAGASSYCAGATGIHITTSGSDAGISYQLYDGTTPAGAAITGTEASPDLDFGIKTAAGTYTIIATNPVTMCSVDLSGSATININPLPTVFTLGGGGGYCLNGGGADIILSGSTSGISYQLNNSGSMLTTVAGTGSAIDFGFEPAAGSYTVVATDPTSSCFSPMSGSPVITILPLPVVHNVTGGGDYCMSGAGRHVGLDNSDPGIHYQLYKDNIPTGAPLTGTGIALDFGLKTASGNYTVVAVNPATTCSSNMNNSATITIDPLPNVDTISGGGTLCAGGPGYDILLSGSAEEGINYQLYRNGIAFGLASGSSDFGIQTLAGIYTAVATNPGTSCSSNMTGSTTITINTPNVFTVTGGGQFCEGGTGVHAGLSGSNTGNHYQLYYDGSGYGDPVAGTGSALDFGLLTGGGAYTVIVTNDTFGCTADMAGSATITVNSNPGTEHDVTGGGRYCAGGTGVDVGLGSSDESINYQLYNGTTAVGLPLTGSGAIDFGLQTAAGTYTVKGTNASTGCSSTMSESAVVTVLPLPTPYMVMVDNFGNYCATDTGLHVRLPNSDAGVSYQLYRGSTPVGVPVTGTGSALDFGQQVVAGTYSIAAADTSSTCTNNMTGSVSINIIPLPTVYDVTGGGGYCPGGPGVNVGLNHSDAGIWYQLYNDSLAVDTPLYGTGVSLNFGMQTAGAYTIVGNSAITTCPNGMFGTAVVSVETLQLPVISIRAYPGLGVGVWHIDSIQVIFTNGGTNPTFQWIINGHPIPGATEATFTHHEFFNGDSVTVEVTAGGPCGGLTATRSVTLALTDAGVTQVTAAGGNIMLIPNPNKGAFTVKGTLGTAGDEAVTLEVTNMLGQVVYSNKVMAENGSLNERVQLGQLANGMYLLNVRSATQNNVIHFVIAQ